MEIFYRLWAGKASGERKYACPTAHFIICAFLEPCLINGEMHSGERFFHQSRRFSLPYSVYGKENQRKAAEKIRRLGVLTFFKQDLGCVVKKNMVS
jgi:hypothetical protein